MIDTDLPLLAADIAALIRRYDYPIGARGDDILPTLPAFIAQVTANAEAADRWAAGGDAARWHPGLDTPEPRPAPGPRDDPASGVRPGAYVLTISHRHGDETTVHPSAEAARSALARFARQWWHEITRPVGGSGPHGGEPSPDVPPADNDEAIRIYFGHQTGESYSITAAARPARETPARELSDAAALDEVAEMLRDPDWGVGMLEDIGELVSKTGRSIEDYPDGRPTWDRH